MKDVGFHRYKKSLQEYTIDKLSITKTLSDYIVVCATVTA